MVALLYNSNMIILTLMLWLQIAGLQRLFCKKRNWNNNRRHGRAARRCWLDWHSNDLQEIGRRTSYKDFDIISAQD